MLKMKTYQLALYALFLTAVSAGCNRLFQLEEPTSKPTQYRFFNFGNGEPVNINLIDDKKKLTLAYGEVSDYQMIEGSDTIRDIAVGDNILRGLRFARSKSYCYYIINGQPRPLPVEENVDKPLSNQSNIRFLSSTLDIKAIIADSAQQDTVKFFKISGAGSNTTIAGTVGYRNVSSGNKIISFLTANIGSVARNGALTAVIDYTYYSFKAVNLKANSVYSVLLTLKKKGDYKTLSGFLVEEGASNVVPLVLDKIIGPAGGKPTVKVIDVSYDFSKYGRFLFINNDPFIGPTPVFEYQGIGFTLNGVVIPPPDNNFVTGVFDPGDYLLNAFPNLPGDVLNIDYLREKVTLEQGKGYTFLTKYDTINKSFKLQILNNELNVPDSLYRLRVIHYLQGVGDVDVKVTINGTTTTIGNLSYGEVRDYISLPGSLVKSSVVITRAGTTQDIYPSQSIKLDLPPGQTGTLLLSVSDKDEPYLYGKSYSDIAGGTSRFPDESSTTVNSNRKTPRFILYRDNLR
jgi:hypothetical protein